MEQVQATPAGKPALNQTTNSSAQTEPQGNHVVTNASEPKADDLIRRMGRAETSNTETITASSDTEPSSVGYSQAEIDSIKDPYLKAQIQEKVKLLEKGYNQKYMKLANERKEVEALKQHLEQQTNQPWTPERVQALMRDPAFVQSAQSLQASQPPVGYEGSSEEWSALSPNEKKQFAALNQAVQAQQFQLNRMLITSEEAKIKEKFPDYDSSKVEKFYADAAAGRVPEGYIRELIHKALNFEPYLERTYKFALQDRNATLSEKRQGSLTQGITTQTAQETPARKEGESSRTLFSRLARGAFAQKQS